MKKDNHNAVDVKVGAFLKKWVVNTYGTDYIRLDKDSNLWSIIKMNLELLPNDYTRIEDRSEYIRFQLLHNSSDTRAYDSATGKVYQPNMLYRCCISKKGEHIIKRFLDKQFKNTFHNYMKGALNNNDDLAITDAITEFLCDSCQPDFDRKTISTLTKDWYRYRKKYPDEFKITIFF